MKGLQIRTAIASIMTVALVVASVCVPVAGAHPSYFASRCASCHTNDAQTCNGCHHHARSLTATPDKSSYFTGGAVTITFAGGSQSGWVRATLYDHQSTQLDRKSGPTSTGDDGLGNLVAFPVALHGTAPTQPGDYTWVAAWFGNSNDAGTLHGEVRVSVVIHVVQDPTDVPGSPPLMRVSWGAIKSLFE